MNSVYVLTERRWSSGWNQPRRRLRCYTRSCRAACRASWGWRQKSGWYWNLVSDSVWLAAGRRGVTSASLSTEKAPPDDAVHQHGREPQRLWCRLRYQVTGPLHRSLHPYSDTHTLLWQPCWLLSHESLMTLGLLVWFSAVAERMRIPQTSDSLWRLLLFVSLLAVLNMCFDIHLCGCVMQEGAGDVLFHGEDAGQHAGRLWDESWEGRVGASQQAQRGKSGCMPSFTETGINPLIESDPSCALQTCTRNIHTEVCEWENVGSFYDAAAL